MDEKISVNVSKNIYCMQCMLHSVSQQAIHGFTVRYQRHSKVNYEKVLKLIRDLRTTWSAPIRSITNFMYTHIHTAHTKLMIK